MLEILEIYRKLVEQNLKSLFSLCTLIKLDACLMKQFIIKHLILYLNFVLLELFVHSLPSFSITEGNYSIKVIVSQLGWLELCGFDEIVK